MISLPIDINFLTVLPAWYLSRDNDRHALLSSLSGGIIAELFSPWRLGTITLIILLGTLATQFMLTRVISVSGMLRLVTATLLLTFLVSLPGAAVSQQYGAFVVGLGLTTFVTLVMRGVYYVRRRQLRAGV